MNFNSIPTVTRYLILINVIVFVFTGFIAQQLKPLFVMSNFLHPNFQPWQLLTSMFTHNDGMHLLFNMFTLFLFGSALENIWGPKRFLQLYMFCGIGAIVLHQGVQFAQIQYLLTSLPGDALNQIADAGGYGFIPEGGGERKNWIAVLNIISSRVMGASGSTTGVLMGYLLLFPNREIYPMFFPQPIKAKLLIPILIGVSLFMGMANFSWDNIAHFAHLGGALFAFILIKIWQKDRTVFY